jgi:primase-polymerase (primpol)-like protein
VPYDAARDAAAEQQADGVSFVIPRGIFFLDIDHRDLKDPIVQEILALFNTYSEYSVSGTGIHIYGLCNVEQLPTWVDPKDGKRKLAKEYYTHHPDNGLELYFGDLTNRFAVFTGSVINHQPLADCTDALLYTLNRYMKRPEAKSALEKRRTRSSRRFGARRMVSNLAVFLMTVSGRNTDPSQRWILPCAL